MFLAYEYLSTIYSRVNLLAIYRVSGLSSMEELLSQLGKVPDNCILVKDSGDGYLDLEDKRLDTGYHLFYIMHHAKANDHASRLAAKRNSMLKGVQLLDQVKKDSVEFGDQAYGFAAKRVDYSEIGPIGQNYYGYSFGFTVEQGINFQALPITPPNEE